MRKAPGGGSGGGGGGSGGGRPRAGPPARSDEAGARCLTHLVQLGACRGRKDGVEMANIACPLPAARKQLAGAPTSVGQLR